MLASLVASPAAAERLLTRSYAVADGLASDRAGFLASDRDGFLWMCTNNGLSRSPAGRRDPRFEPIPLGVEGIADDRAQVWSFAEDVRGGLWVGTPAALVHRPRDGRTLHFPVTPAQGSDHVQEIVIDDQERLWMAHDRGLLVCVPETAPGDTNLLAATVPRVPTENSPREHPPADRTVGGGS